VAVSSEPAIGGMSDTPLVVIGGLR
jgi:hypothetical protein